jgi:CheY-like chemotaxis protein
MAKVLIVDDDAQLLLIITEGLKHYENRFQVVTVSDGLAAIRALQKETFSAVVSDIQMPTINGLVLLAYMSRNFPKIPCIMMTGYPSPFLEKQMQDRAAFYIEKPFKVKKLAQAIISVLGGTIDLSGTLNGISLASFLKMAEMEYLSCICEVSSPEDEIGYLVFERGNLLNASYGKLRGEEAALGLLQDGVVKIRFRKMPNRKFVRRIEKKVSDLLIKRETLGETSE